MIDAPGAPHLPYAAGLFSLAQLLLLTYARPDH